MEQVVLGRSGDGEVARACPGASPCAARTRLGLIAGGVISAYRASLVERDLWGHVSRKAAQHGPYSAEWLDAIGPLDWVEVGAFVQLLDAIGETMGIETLRSLVRKRIADPAGSNFYAPILRSWARSFGKSPELMLRGVVHVWKAALRHAGQLRPVSVHEGEVHLLIEGPLAQSYRESAALRAELEGLCLGLLDYAQPRPVFVEVDLHPEREPVALVCSFGG